MKVFMDESPFIDALLIQEQLTPLFNKLSLQLSRAQKIEQFKNELTHVGLTDKRFSEISKECYEFGIKPKMLHPKALLTEIIISTESEGDTSDEIKNMIESMKSVLDRIDNLVKRFSVYNQILLEKIKTQIHSGVFASSYSVDMVAYEFLSVPFFRQTDLNKALSALHNVVFSDAVTDADTFQEAIPENIVKASEVFGIFVNENDITREDIPYQDKTLEQLGWTPNELSSLAKKAIDVLENIIVEGVRVVKFYKTKIGSVKTIEEAEVLSKKLRYTQKLFMLVETDSIFMARRTLDVADELEEIEERGE